MNVETLTYSDTLYARRWLVIITIMMVAILEVLDSTIVNVALPSIMPALGANQNQITWILTSYVVASAVILPLTGFISNRMGQKQMLIMSISGFMISSLLCGIATSLPEMVLFRILQGACGASLIPLSQAILRQTFPLDQQGKAMAIWGIGIMAAPVLGPTLGGFITEHSSWRWIFYINLPVCLLGLALTVWVIPKTNKILQKIDWLGLILMIIGTATMQIFLDKGNEKNWFNSNLILSLAITSAFCLVWFISRSLIHRFPVVKLKIYRDRNFMICSLLLLLFCGSIFGMLTLQPIMLETLFGYPPITTGWTLAPLGLASGVSMMMVSNLINRVNIKIILTLCMIISAYAAYRLTMINLHTSMDGFLIDNAIMGFAMGGFMVPLTTYALATVAKSDITEASGLFSYGRMVGTSVGISLLSTLVSRTTQTAWHTLAGHATPFSHSYHAWLAYQQLNTGNASGVVRLAHVVQQQSSLIGFIDGFKAIAFVFIGLIPLILFLKRVDLSAKKTPQGK